jgi:hypothetical protein
MTMKKIIVSAALFLAVFSLASLSLINDGYVAGTPALAACMADEIRNDCCFKFFKVLEGDAVVVNTRTREVKAVAEFRRCLRKDLGCSVEMTEMKSKNASQIRQICR